MLIVEMLSTGDEVLHGQIVDTNAAWLADCLFQQGIPLHSRTTVGDSLDSLVETFIERSHHADVVIVNGGLGPTSDDLSALAAATAAGVPLVEHPEWIAVMESYFTARRREIPATNRKQAMLPANAELIDNPVGTACGFALYLNDCWFFFTPGVPSEFKVMVNEQIIPRLRQKLTLPEPPICLRLTSFGRSESSLARQFDPLELPKECVLGYRSSMPIIELKLTGPANQRNAMEQVWRVVKAGVGDNKVFEGTEGIGALVQEALEQQQLSVVTHEQFSAGLLYWTLNAAKVSVTQGNIEKSAVQSDLATLVQTAKNSRSLNQCEIGLVVGDYHEGVLSLALSTPTGSYAQSVNYLPRNHSELEKQQVSVMLMLDMLSRWLEGRPIIGDYEWLEQIQVMEVS
ncbi:nicotinamide mononucleotide deamidase-related protein YfaY [Providencia zhijiangensis]|uniref:CinA-like protein n=1 Tax=Providencia zhijiangensis TaxID=3053982 RepID=A0ABZ0N698_9GAMM|nr:nicotinamide mononucleotide deamidase-related protein YfaY [Providencia sp. D4759]WPA93859.1 nicotinamide mononucleotide deamidase-related protein YfaY [Providencia sp. D4759]